jgi:hypothetical protein
VYPVSTDPILTDFDTTATQTQSGHRWTRSRRSPNLRWRLRRAPNPPYPPSFPLTRDGAFAGAARVPCSPSSRYAPYSQPPYRDDTLVSSTHAHTCRLHITIQTTAAARAAAAVANGWQRVRGKGPCSEDLYKQGPQKGPFLWKPENNPFIHQNGLPTPLRPIFLCVACQAPTKITTSHAQRVRSIRPSSRRPRLSRPTRQPRARPRARA